MSIYITGDIHGNPRRLSNKNLRLLGLEITEGDKVIVCGDFGLPWYDDVEDEYWLNWLEEKPFEILFVDGNHENFDLLYQFPVEERYGGKVHRVRSNVYHLMRGEIFEINEKSFFVIGGCASSQKWINAGKPRYDGEAPTEDEIIYAKENLRKYSNSVDYILTHKYLQEDTLTEPPNSLEGLIHYLKSSVKYNAWYFGHDHIDMSLDEKHFYVYDILKKIT